MKNMMRVGKLNNYQIVTMHYPQVVNLQCVFLKTNRFFTRGEALWTSELCQPGFAV